MRLFAIAHAAAAALARRQLADSNLPPARWANEQLPDPRQEAQAKALMEELRCLGLPGPVDRRQQCRTGGRHARHGPPADRRWREARAGPGLADRALRELGQLSSAGRADDLAAVGGADLLLLAGAWLLRKRLVRRRG